MQKVNFDWSLSIGNVLSILAMAGGLGTVWVSADRRITVIEQRSLEHSRAMDTAKTEQATQKAETRESLKEIKDTQQRMSDKLDRILYEMAQTHRNGVKR